MAFLWHVSHAFFRLNNDQCVCLVFKHSPKKRSKIWANNALLLGNLLDSLSSKMDSEHKHSHTFTQIL